MASAQDTKQQPVKSISEVARENVHMNRSVGKKKIFQNVSSRSSDKQLRSRNADQEPHLAKASSEHRIPRQTMSQCLSTERPTSVGKKSLASRRLSRLDTKELPPPIEATISFRSKSPSCYAEQMEDIEASFVQQLSEMETHSKLRKVRSRSLVYEKEPFRLSQIQQPDIQEPTSRPASTSSGPKTESEYTSSHDQLAYGLHHSTSTCSLKKKRRESKKKVNVKLAKEKEEPQKSVYIVRRKFGKPKTKVFEKYLSEQKKMLRVTTWLGLPDPEVMPAVALPLLHKPPQKLTLKEMASLVELAEPTETSQLVRFYVEWAVDLQDDADISFFLETVNLIGLHLRHEIANLYEVNPYDLLIRQTRGRRKRDGAVVVMTVSCAFADEWGTIVMDKDVEQIKMHTINDREKVPLPGDWRALIQTLNVDRPRLRLEEKRRLIRMYEHARALRIRRNSTAFL